MKLAKIYTFTRGDYHRRAPRGDQQLGRGGSARACTCSWCATATRRRASRASTSPSPARRSTPTPGKFQKVEFKKIEKHQAGDSPPCTTTTGENGWVAMVQHYFASAWLPGNGQACRAEFFTGKVDTNTYSVGHVPAGGRGGPRQHQGLRRPALRRPAGETSSPRWPRAGAGEGLRLVHHPSPSRCSGCSRSCTACSATGAGRSSRWWCC